MTTSRSPMWLTSLLVCVLALGLCQCGRRAKDHEHAVVSSAAIDTGKSFEPVAQLPEVDVFYGEGDCGPRLPNGMRGTCIDAKPCNGFGFKDANGKIQCGCFDKVGGCDVNEACSLLRRRCVPLYEIERSYPAKGR